MLHFTLNRAYSDGTYSWLVGVDTDLNCYLGTVYVQTTVTLALREYNLPNAVTPFGWDEHTPCWQR